MFQPDNKKGGIFKMMKILQAPIQDVVVFGDDYNDLDMFDKDLWTGVAMGNACDALKEKQHTSQIKMQMMVFIISVKKWVGFNKK